MRVFAFKNANDLLRALASGLANDFASVDTGSRGGGCRESREWHVEQIRALTDAINDGAISAVEGARGINILSDCMAASEREQEFRIHSTQEDDTEVTDLLNSIFGGGREPRSPITSLNRLLKAGPSTSYGEDVEDENDKAELADLLEVVVRTDPRTASFDRVKSVIERLNVVSARIQAKIGTPPPASLVSEIGRINEVLTRINDEKHLSSDQRLPLLTLGQPPQATPESGSGTGQTTAQNSATSDSRGLVQPRKRGRRKTRTAPVAKTGVNSNRSRAQKLRWKKIRAAQQQKGQPKATRKK